MTTVSMIPPSNGQHNTIAINGRTYSSTPGIAILVPDFDAAVLQANGWLTLVQATTVGQVAQADVTAIKTGLAYKGASPSSFTVPPGALGIWSTIRTANYAGPCLNIRRSSDNATQDIGFLGDIVDYAAADAFIGAANTGFVTAWYDQSGSGHNLTQAVPANQPVFVRSSQWNGIRPITEPNPGGATFPPAFLESAAVSFNANACTIVAVLSPRESYTDGVYWRAAATSAGADLIYLGTSLSAQISDSPGLGLATSGQVPIAGIKVAAGSYGAATIIDVDGIQAVYGATTSAALGYISFGNSLLVGPTRYNLHGDYFFAALYPSAFTGPQLVALRTTLTNAFVPPVPNLKNIVWGGGSEVPAFGGTHALSLPYIAGFGRASVHDGALTYPALPDWKLYQLGVGGRTLAAEFAGRAVWLTAGFDATKAKNVYVLAGVSNDIANSGGYASTAAAKAAMLTLYSGTFLPYLAAIRAAGYSAIIVTTVFPRGDVPFQLGTGNFMDDARLAWNTLIKATAATNGYIVSDRAADPAFSATTAYLNTTYYAADKIHPTDAGNIIIAGIDRAAILSA